MMMATFARECGGGGEGGGGVVLVLEEDMGHHCCSKQKVKRGLWSPEEDEKLVRHITTHGHGCWSSVPKLAGLFSVPLFINVGVLLLLEPEGFRLLPIPFSFPTSCDSA